MGFIWNVILSFDDEELWEDDEDEARDTCEPLERINAWLPYGRLVSLTGPTYKNNVGAGLDANLYGGGFKHLDIEGFIEVVKSQAWKARSKVQLWIKGGVEGMATEPFMLVKLGGRRAGVKRTGSDKKQVAEPKAAETKRRRVTGQKAAEPRNAKKNQTWRKNMICLGHSGDR